MSKTIAIFGSTGQQGISVINHVLNDPELSRAYNVRAITRDVHSEKAKQFGKKVSVVQGDMSDRASLETALTGVHTVFIVTMPSFGPGGLETEYNTGKTVADVALEKGAKYIIFSTLPPVSEISGGKYTMVSHFDAKAKIEQYIRGLRIKSVFISLGSFMENFQAIPFLAPQKASDGTWVISRHNSPKAQLPIIDATGDVGKLVGAILAEPEKYQGRTFCGGLLYSWEEVAAIMSKATGKAVIYKQVPLDVWKSSLPFGADIFAETFSYPEEFGYYGPETERLVAWATENARGRLSSFEEYLQAHPLQLA
ncbi:hypothetical protein LTR85_011691 [Meristemomyces frigidus]|nr:hypothetical protein LTR85_011691 [Meristemomyces frigidus]